MSASIDLCRKLTGAMRLLNAAEGDAAMHKFCEMLLSSNLNFSDLCIRPAEESGADPIEDSYLLKQLDETARRMEAAYRAAEADRKKAEAKIAKLQKELDTANRTVAAQTEQIAELTKPLPTKVTYARWNCLHDIAEGLEVTDNRSFTACLKAGWVTEAGALTKDGKAILRTDEPAAPKPRESVKKLRVRLEAVEQERDQAYDRVDELLTILEAPEDALWACQAAVGVINGFRMKADRMPGDAAH